MDNNILLQVIGIILGILFIYHIYFHSSNLEHMSTTSTINNEAIQNLASIYNGNKLIVDELEVTGNAKIKGDTVCDKTLKVNNNYTGHIESGRKSFGSTGGNTASITQTHNVVFSKPFTTVPKVATSLSKIDFYADRNLRIIASAINITKTGFTVKIFKWDNTWITASTVTWIAHE